MNEALERFKLWAIGLLEFWKARALTELDPRNPDKRRFLCAWGLLICGGLFLVMGVAFVAMYRKGD